MYLYVDETENEKYFIVAGLLVDSAELVENSYRHFKKRLNSFKINPKTKSKIYTEFKANILDNHYQKIKIKMIQEICKTKGTIIYSCHAKKSCPFKQKEKETVYIRLLSSIVKTIKEKTNIVFDSFGKKDFEERIVNTLGAAASVNTITPGDSEKIHGNR